MDITASGRTFTLCVFCGSSKGNHEFYMQGAKDLAEQMAAKSWSLLYGGGSLGLMGLLASSLVEIRGPNSVHGIIPRAFLQTGKVGDELPDVQKYGHTTVVSTMHERKRLMLDHSEAFVALPGGYGTMEELFEMTTWSQLGIHNRPIVIFNINGFFDDLLNWVHKAVREGFISESLEGIIYEAKTAQEVVDCVERYQDVAGRYTFLDWSIPSNVVENAS
ncbi:hypothetical protein BKA66DRAFT_586307 [Pyrenochaeta sp. MPI-SDFR-AT-0127]|nr:hypothetical protein BKA66DRAFT_586307 [Pyrenochaeta sp. MPI-SDFR-AT-0127]